MVENLSLGKFIIFTKWMFGLEVSNRDVSNDYPIGDESQKE